MTKNIELITDAEWEIMRVVWTKNETTSTEVIDILEKKMGWKPSTVKTLLSRLVTKKYLETRKEGKQFIYCVVVSEQKAIKAAGNELLDKICDRKVGSMLVEMIERKTLSTKDIEAIEMILNKKKESAPEVVPCNCIPGQCLC